jgi:hypothetical protein
MPRIYTSANDPMDFCLKCFPKTEAYAEELYGDLGDGPDGRGNCFAYDEEHPNYDGEGYRCTNCGKSLKLKDNYID